MTKGSEFEDLLREQDSLSLPHRAERLRFLFEKFGESRHMLVPQMAYYYIEESKLCYLNGAFVACVLVVQAALEDILRDFYRLQGNDKLVEKGFKDLINKSSEDGLISDREAAEMHSIRELRNPYQHTKLPMHEKGFSRRIQKSNFEKDEWDLMREDAEKALICLFELIGRYPFSFYLDENE
ncbi:MAG: DUF4145 domain-containing protein [Calditrichaeota bacterium]|nr:DUF4145 domain-containing protein [Calditrichota bacterium]